MICTIMEEIKNIHLMGVNVSNLAIVTIGHIPIELYSCIEDQGPLAMKERNINDYKSHFIVVHY